MVTRAKLDTITIWVYDSHRVRECSFTTANSVSVQMLQSSREAVMGAGSYDDKECPGTGMDCETRNGRPVEDKREERKDPHDERMDRLREAEIQQRERSVGLRK